MTLPYSHFLIQVPAYSTEAGNYSLKYEFAPIEKGDEKEPNNETTEAEILNVNDTFNGYIGHADFVEDNDSVDWYKIEVPSDGILQVDVSINNSLSHKGELFSQIGGNGLPTYGVASMYIKPETTNSMAAKADEKNLLYEYHFTK